VTSTGDSRASRSYVFVRYFSVAQTLAKLVGAIITSPLALCGPEGEILIMAVGLLTLMSEPGKKESKCAHDKLEYLGDQKGERGVNKYYRCMRCGSVLILSEDGTWYEVPASKQQ